MASDHGLCVNHPAVIDTFTDSKMEVYQKFIQGQSLLFPREVFTVSKATFTVSKGNLYCFQGQPLLFPRETFTVSKGNLYRF